MNIIDSLYIGTFTVLLGGLMYCVFDYSALDSKQKLFKDTYNKSIQCRQSISKDPNLNIDQICGKIPQINEFVK